MLACTAHDSKDIRARRIPRRIRRRCNQILFTSVHPIYFLSYTQFFYTYALSFSYVRVDTYCNVLPTKFILLCFTSTHLVWYLIVLANSTVRGSVCIIFLSLVAHSMSHKLPSNCPLIQRRLRTVQMWTYIFLAQILPVRCVSMLRVSNESLHGRLSSRRSRSCTVNL